MLPLPPMGTWQRRHGDLVGGFNLPLWKMMKWKSVGMMAFTIYGTNIKTIFQTTNQKMVIHGFSILLRVKMWILTLNNLSFTMKIQGVLDDAPWFGSKRVDFTRIRMTFTHIFCIFCQFARRVTGHQQSSNPKRNHFLEVGCAVKILGCKVPSIFNYSIIANPIIQYHSRLSS